MASENLFLHTSFSPDQQQKYVKWAHEGGKQSIWFKIIWNLDS